jgi:methyl-accepting chemotaxis protein
MNLFRSRNGELGAIVSAIHRSQAVIEFNVDGTILTANENFLNTLGYNLDEIAGKHHRMFVDTDYANSADYAEFWSSLARGQYKSAEFRRIAKDGSHVWIQASYNPILGRDGKPYKVIKFATDITAQKNRTADYEAQIQAISKSQAVIEFDLDGTIRTANENFLNALGYSLDEIAGQHHRMFVDPDHARSSEYSAFWDKLRSGAFHAGEYRRIAKDGRDVWIQASYNPIFDSSGKPTKVVKYATDVTAVVEDRRRMAEIQETIDKELAEIAETMTRTSASGADAASTTSETVQAVSAATEQMSSSIRQIGAEVDRASDMTRTTVAAAEESGNAISGLAEAAAKIGDVVELIDDIANQTNMLALNATIEAARAGEAGKGFAVVASEVKSLANQTAKATDEIRNLVARVQQSTEGSVASIASISEAITALDAIEQAIARAVQEQSDVTSDIAGNMHTASTGVATVADGFRDLVEVTERINETIGRIRQK